MILLKFCLILVAVNALTIGGGFVMLPMLQKEFVERNHWLTNQEFLDAIAIGQVTPGPLTVMNAFIGYKISGLFGAILAMVSSYLPCVVIVVLVVKFYYAYKESRIVDPTTVGIAVISFSAITSTDVDPTFVILGGGIVGALVY